jgi:hypothetical protein
VKGRRENNESRSKVTGDGALTGTHGGGKGAATAGWGFWESSGLRLRVGKYENALVLHTIPFFPFLYYLGSAV